MWRRCLFIAASGSFLARTLQSNLKRKSNCTPAAVFFLKQWNCIVHICIFDTSIFLCLCENFNKDIKRIEWTFFKLFPHSPGVLTKYSFNFTSLYKINRFEIRNMKAKEIFVGLCRSGLWIKQNTPSRPHLVLGGEMDPTMKIFSGIFGKELVICVAQKGTKDKVKRREGGPALDFLYLDILERFQKNFNHRHWFYLMVWLCLISFWWLMIVSNSFWNFAKFPIKSDSRP